mmetsp:Transcript_102979/g.297797  ORF Transcript_102979/g.297797 Transcript_102979/m.297797 type:complete len:228 (-) Transcript_102979:686-1369(-)
MRRALDASASSPSISRMRLSRSSIAASLAEHSERKPSTSSSAAASRAPRSSAAARNSVSCWRMASMSLALSASSSRRASRSCACASISASCSNARCLHACNCRPISSISRALSNNASSCFLATIRDSERPASKSSNSADCRASSADIAFISSAFAADSPCSELTSASELASFAAQASKRSSRSAMTCCCAASCACASRNAEVCFSISLRCWATTFSDAPNSRRAMAK